uniref:Uncharacterized protein MANES_01G275000 n=1 Tax=Rhizophora mucronata TaxID=61149 RepID=A0A2P2MIP5_RHIMU
MWNELGTIGQCTQRGSNGCIWAASLTSRRLWPHKGTQRSRGWPDHHHPSSSCLGFAGER